MPPILLKNKRFTPNHMFNACTFCITAAAGTKLAGASSLNLIIILFSEKGLRPIRYCDFNNGIFLSLLPLRGLAGSGFRRLSKIPYCRQKAWAFFQSQCG